MKHPHSKNGFTLVEVLVVTAIIGLLAAILFPVFSSVRESARTASCASNLKQIGMAISLYVQDNNQRYPLIAQQDGLTWVDTVHRYAKSADVFVCPSAENGEYVPGGSPQSPIIMGTAGPQYGDNGSYDMVTPFVEKQTVTTETGWTSTYRVQPQSLSATKYRSPSSTILVLDGGDTTHYFHNNYAALNPGIDSIHTVADLKDGGVLERHKEGVNLLYVDGHVKRQGLEQLTSTPRWRHDGREPAPAATTAPGG